ncbi:MAG: Cas10/Cmr2 second palm domain-containing protein [Bryobacteraceae bacterium]
MSLQVFLYAQFRGIERFVSGTSENSSFADRSLWVSLLTEITPRAFLAERGLSPLLVGYAGGGSFLLLLPEPTAADAAVYLSTLRDAVAAETAGELQLHWALTENLGTWPNVWKRLTEGIRAKRQSPLAHLGAAAFAADVSPAPAGEAPWTGLAARMDGTASVGWIANAPVRFLAGEGARQWTLGAAPDAIAITMPPASPQDLGRKAHGRRAWGMFRCDIDRAGARLQLADSAENFLYLAILYKGLVAGELQRIVAMPAHAGRVSILYSGGDDFAVAGAWDALLSVASEFHRVFTLFAGDLPGGKELTEGASLSAALTVAETGETLAGVWRRNRISIETVKSSGGNAFALFDRILDWPALKDAEGLKLRIRKLRDVYHCPPEVFEELEDFYGVRGAGDVLASPRARRRERSVDRPWRFHSRLRRLAGDRTGSEFERQWRAFLGDLIGRGQVQKQLRPAGKVALDWARLESGWRGQD